MDENILWHRKTIINKTSENLKKNNFNAVIAETMMEASQKILALINVNESVAFGGSQTVKSMQLEASLKERGNEIISPPAGASFEETIKTRKKALTADVYISSPNALTIDGKLIFVDKIGNRSSAMVFGPQKVIAVAGFNKIAIDEQSGFQRISNTAAPINAKRLNLNTPCSVTGICSDCNSQQRICNISVTLRKKPAYTDYYVVLINQDIGY